MSSRADPPSTEAPSKADARLAFLDALRVMALGLLIAYHVGMYYVTWDWHLKSPFASTTLEPWMRLVNPWRMGLLFLISGAVTAILLQRARRAEFNIAGGWDPRDPAGPGASPAVIATKWPDASKVWKLNHGFPSGVSGKPIFSVKKGSVVVVALANRSAWVQVIRLHGHVFRVLHPLDDGWEPFFLDTVIVPENRTVRIAFNADNVGKWLIRSTIIEHMEGGVISWFEVVA
jgi:hypothetical protein